ncbi:MAG: hypothetical protein ABSF83_06955 [Nitrososphaerales archaeon]
MRRSGTSLARVVVIALVGSLVVLGAAGYAYYYGVGGTLGRDQSSQSPLGGADRTSLTITSPDQNSSTASLTSTTTATATETYTQTTTETVTEVETTTTVCESSTVPNQNSTGTQPIGSCGSGGAPTQFQVEMAVDPSGSGTTTPQSGTVLGIQERGILVQVSATANPGYAFTSWTSSTPAITFACTTCTTTGAEVDGTGTVVANFVAQSGPAYVTQVCSAHGYYQKTVSCTFPSPVEKGQTILLESGVIAGTSVTDSMGDHFSLVAQTGCPCSSTYLLEVFSSTAAATGTDTIAVDGAGNYDSIVADALTGVLGVEGTSTGTGTSTSPGVAPYSPASGSLVVGIALINNTEGVYGTTVGAGSGYTLLTAGPDVSDEYAIASGNATASPFALGTPENWGEVSVAFTTAASALTTETIGEGMVPVPSNGPSPLVVLLLFCSSGADAGLGSRPARGASRAGKTVLCDGRV